MLIDILRSAFITARSLFASILANTLYMHPIKEIGLKSLTFCGLHKTNKGTLTYKYDILRVEIQQQRAIING